MYQHHLSWATASQEVRIASIEVHRMFWSQQDTCIHHCYSAIGTGTSRISEQDAPDEPQQHCVTLVNAGTIPENAQEHFLNCNERLFDHCSTLVPNIAAGSSASYTGDNLKHERFCGHRQPGQQFRPSFPRPGSTLNLQALL